MSSVGSVESVPRVSVDDFELLGVLGKGGFATVYNARYRPTGREVALKVMDKNVLKSSRLCERVRQEVGIHAQLRHRSVLRLLGFFEDTARVYLILELCVRGELSRYVRLKGNKLGEEEAGCFIRQLVDGLVYLHSQRVVHRDLSLSNLLLTHDLQVKIADFGLATQLIRGDERHVTLCGTPNYISPEVATRSAHGTLADVWGVGCLLYTLLVGRPPFDTEGVRGTLTKVVMSEPDIPSSLSVEARDLLQRLLRKNPEHRLPLKDVLKHPFLHKSMQASALDSGMGPSGFTPSSCQHSSIHSHHSDPSYTNIVSQSHSDMCRNNTSHNETCRSQPRCCSHGSDALMTTKSGTSSTHTCDSCVQKSRNSHITSGHSSVVPTTSLAQTCSSTSLMSLTPPLSSERLRPTRQRTSNAVLSILLTGEVCLEFLKRDYVVSVCRISSDGLRIVLYPAMKNFVVSDSPPPVPHDGADSMFSYESLPEKHWKKYVYASRFALLVKAKTPKVSMYSSEAKVQLMESGDCEAVFYAGGKVVHSHAGVVRITEPHKSEPITLKESSIENNLGATAQCLLKHFQQCRSRCLLQHEYSKSKEESSLSRAVHAKCN